MTLNTSPIPLCDTELVPNCKMLRRCETSGRFHHEQSVKRERQTTTLSEEQRWIIPPTLVTNGKIRESFDGIYEVLVTKTAWGNWIRKRLWERALGIQCYPKCVRFALRCLFRSYQNGKCRINRIFHLGVNWVNRNRVSQEKDVPDFAAYEKEIRRRSWLSCFDDDILINAMEVMAQLIHKSFFHFLIGDMAYKQH